MFELTYQALYRLGFIFTAELRKALLTRRYPYGHPQQKGLGNKVASGNLLDSIGFEVQEGQNGAYQLVVQYADYFKYVNEGRVANAKRVPLNALLDWISFRGIRPRDKNGRFIENNLVNRTRLAFAVQQNIFRYGIRRSNIYDIGLGGVEDLLDPYNPPPNTPPELLVMYQELFDAIEEDINNFVENTIVKELQRP
jgi:hypothetical protein